MRAIGGSWTERLHSDAQLLELAHRWSTVEGFSHRTCPLCRALPGTPRHVVMSCPAMLPLVQLLRDDMEAELLRSAPLEHIAEAQRLHLARARSPTVGDSQRWPILANWQWLVPMCSEVNDFGNEPGNNSAASTAAEGASHLAVSSPPSPDAEEVLDIEDEQHGTSQNLSSASAEAEGSHASFAAEGLQVHCACSSLASVALVPNTCKGWVSDRANAMRASLDSVEVAADVPVPLRVVDPIPSWLASPSGRAMVRELRWLVPDERTAISRFRLAFLPQGTRVSDTHVLRLLSSAGVPLRDCGSVVRWNSEKLSWHLARSLLLRQCTCADAGERPRQPVQCCPRCCGALFADIAPEGPLPCPWCRQRSVVSCRACGVSLHFRGQCAWNHGANNVFRPSADNPTLLCPDCHWSWLCARSSLPWTRAGPSPPAIQQLMASLSDGRAPGAGVWSSRVVATLRQRLRRYLRRRISPTWVTLEERLGGFRAACAPIILPLAELAQRAAGHDRRREQAGYGRFPYPERTGASAPALARSSGHKRYALLCSPWLPVARFECIEQCIVLLSSLLR